MEIIHLKALILNYDLNLVWHESLVENIYMYHIISSTLPFNMRSVHKFGIMASVAKLKSFKYFYISQTMNKLLYFHIKISAIPYM